MYPLLPLEMTPLAAESVLCLTAAVGVLVSLMLNLR